MGMRRVVRTPNNAYEEDSLSDNKKTTSRWPPELAFHEFGAFPTYFQRYISVLVYLLCRAYPACYVLASSAGRCYLIEFVPPRTPEPCTVHYTLQRVYSPKSWLGLRRSSSPPPLA